MAFKGDDRSARLLRAISQGGRTGPGGRFLPEEMTAEQETGVLAQLAADGLIRRAGERLTITFTGDARLAGDSVVSKPDPVQRELDALMRYARAVGRSAERFPSRQDILSGGRGYIGGTLTTLQHLGLISQEQFREWFDRAMGELPPVPTSTFGHSELEDGPPRES